MKSNYIFLLSIFLVQVISVYPHKLVLLDTFYGLVGGGNYSHFTLHDTGRILVEVTSVEGDADIYFCEKSMKCDASNYDLQSITYGVDEIDVTKTVRRPASYSIFGHSYYPSSKFILKKYRIELSSATYDQLHAEANENVDKYFGSFSKESNDFESPEPKKPPQPKKYADSDELDHFDEEDEHESLLWTILLHLIKFLAEVVL